MRIGMVHFRVGDLDGVSLEMDKWRVVLERMGHEVSYLAGSVGHTDGYAVPELSLNFESASLIQKNAFYAFTDFKTEDEFESHIRALTKQIKRKIQHYIDKFEIQCLIPNNMFGLPMNIAASLALFEIIKENELIGIDLNHDFYWERKSYNPTVPLIQRYLDEFFPPKLPGIKHVVINSLAQKALEQKKGIQSSIIPNVFYFDEKLWEEDDFNCDIRERLNIDPTDIFVLHATRIIRRKGIELMIDLLEELTKEENLRKLQEKPLYDGRKFSQHNKYVLVFPNLIEDFKYKEKLELKLKNSSIDYCFCNDYFASERMSEPCKKCSLWDAYVHADIVSYPSLLEGWGNQFLEAVKAKLPLVIFEYDTYETDIKPTGFQTISLGAKIEKYDENGFVRIDQAKIAKAAEEIIRVLQDSKFRETMVNKNYAIGKEKFSLQALAYHIEKLLEA